MSERDERSQGRAPRLTVGIGASAGGLDACKALLAAMPPDSGIAFVVIMHLDPGHESHIAQIFAASTAMEVVQVSESMPLVANRVYVIAPDSSLELSGGTLNPSKPKEPRGLRKPVDALFSSLAANQGERAVAIVLSGTGNNGSKGILDVKAGGGLCLAQEPESAEYDGMPRHSIETGVIDRVLRPEEMPKVLLEYAERPGLPPGGAGDEEAGEGSPRAFDAILGLLSAIYGVNFRSSYKRGTLQRRTERRVKLKEASDWNAYLDILHGDPKEVAALYADLLIGVTQFFRDPEVWKVLETEVIPELFEGHDDALPLKVWVPGCATGEEPYSLAMALLEHRERLGRMTKIQIFASDVADSAVAFARRGLYPVAIEEAVSPRRLERFFHRRGESFEICREVRDMVTFAVHNLLADPPFSQLDLVSCRNVLIYLETHAQHRVIELFHFALKPRGVLLLGASETIGRYSNLFETLSEKASIYRSAASSEAARHGQLRWTAAHARVRGAVNVPGPVIKGPRISRGLEKLVLSRYTQACVAITEAFEIQAFFGPTENYLTQPTGEARMDLLAWLKPGLYARLRRGLETARETEQQVQVSETRIERGDGIALVECTIDPISSVPGEGPMFLVSFRDLPQVPAAGRELPAEAEAEAPLARQLESELKSTREELRDVVEQLASANDEYRASTEELLSLNEELQSTNEELEASKEELQSLNEEMATINRQLEDKNRELRSAYDDLNNLVVSTDIPIIFLDRDLRVRRFTPAATRLMRLVPSDVGRSLEYIKQRFRDGSLLDDARAVIEKLVPITAELETEEGRWYVRNVVPYRTEDGRVDGACVAFHDVTERRRAGQQVEEARDYAEAIVDTVRAPLVVLDAGMRVVSANRAFHDKFRVTAAEIEGERFWEIGDHHWDVPRLRTLLERVLPEKNSVQDYEVEQEFDPGDRRVLRLNGRLMSRRGQADLILLIIEDITERRAAERITAERASELADENRRKDRFLAMLGHELRNPLAALMHGLDLLSARSADRDKVEQLRRMMARHAGRISGMLDELLDVARLTAGKVRIARVPVNLADVVKAAVEASTPMLAEREHELTVSLPEEDVYVRGDLGRLTQVVENLLNNAAKYTEDGGEIALSVEADEDSVAIRVRDNGIGIDPDLLPHIFGLFTQDDRALDRAGGGLGLGLPLVKNVVEMHRGKVEASSPGRGHGSEFVVTLPRLRDRAALRGDGASAAPGRRRILVVDDERDSAATLAEILSMEGHEARAVYSGPDALDEARRFHPDVVLLDLGLPRMDGYEVARHLREEHGDEPLLVALTGYRRDAERLRRAGFDRHLIKPPDMDRLSRWLVAPRDAKAVSEDEPQAS